MNLVLTGSSELTLFDEKEIENYLDANIYNSPIAIFAYRSIERVVMRYFIKNEKYAPKLTLYTANNVETLPQRTKEPLEYLLSVGSSHVSFHHPDFLIKRSQYIQYWTRIIKEAESVVCFYNNQNASFMIPIDIAKKMKKDTLIYDLPGNDQNLFEMLPERKIRTI